MGYDNCFNANRRAQNRQRVNRSQCTFPFGSIEIDCESRISVSTAKFSLRSLYGFYEGSREETYFFYLLDLFPVPIPTYMPN